jgi:hypothetical protein
VLINFLTIHVHTPSSLGRMTLDLERESQQRFKNAFEALRLPDPDDYNGTIVREYQKELARNLQKEYSKAASVSMDQQIAGKLSAAGYSLDDIKNVIELHSPLAVKPTIEHRQAYANAVVQKAYPLRGDTSNSQSDERRLDKLGIETKTKDLAKNKSNCPCIFKCIFVDRDYSIFEYHGQRIYVPVDDDTLISVYNISRATYEDTRDAVQEYVTAALKSYLTHEATKEGIEIEFE